MGAHPDIEFQVHTGAVSEPGGAGLQHWVERLFIVCATRPSLNPTYKIFQFVCVTGCSSLYFLNIVDVRAIFHCWLIVQSLSLNWAATVFAFGFLVMLVILVVFALVVGLFIRARR